jgi:type VI protein secretion system component Hcp
VYAPAAPPLPLHETQVGEMEVSGITGATPRYSDSWGLFTAGGGGGGGGGAGAATFSDYEVTKAIDAETDTLLTRMLTGAHTATVDIRLFEPGTQSVQTTVELTEVLLISWEAAASLSGLERVDFAYETITQTTDRVTRCWDVQAETAC